MTTQSPRNPNVDRSAMGSRRLEQSAMYFSGALLVLSGLFHIFVWAIDGGSLSGDVSWRKPILFGFSAGVTMLSLGWLVGKLKPRLGDSLLFTAFSAAMLAEVSLITLQQWRGVASHFNRATPFDANVLGWIEGLILFATIVIADLTFRSFGTLRVTSDMKLAIRGGMALLLFACLLGFILVGYGNYQQSIGGNPGVYGEAGVMKFPHGMPIHAIQYFPFLAWCLTKLRVKETVRLAAVRFALLSVVAFTIFSLIQTFTGRARFDIGWVSGFTLALSIGLMAMPIVLVVRGFVRSVAKASTARRWFASKLL